MEIPEGLDQIEPGPILAALLSTIEVSELSGYDRIVVLRADQRMASHYQARTYQDMASVADLISEEVEAEFAFDAAAAEIRAALCLTRRAAESELSFALDLKQRLPKVWKAMASGDIDLWRAKTIVYGTCHLGVDTAREVVDQIIGKAARLTTGQLNALLRKVCVQADPEEAASRYQHAVTERRVIMEANDTGTANLLGLDLPPHRVTAICAHITNIAKGLRGGGESRSMDQLKADILLDLLEGKTHQRGSRRGMVDITVDLDTLAGLSQTAGELSGFGPVIADIARQVTEQQHGTGWRWKVTHPDSGQPLHEGITRRRPNRGRRRSVEARNRTCVFPGCRMPATECDLDHRIPGRRVDRPGSATWHPSAGMTIIGSDTKPDGNTDCYPTATTSGPAASATPTPPAANRHNGREDVGVLLVTFERRALLTTPSQTPARQLHRPVVDR